MSELFVVTRVGHFANIDTATVCLPMWVGEEREREKKRTPVLAIGCAKGKVIKEMVTSV